MKEKYFAGSCCCIAAVFWWRCKVYFKEPPNHVQLTKLVYTLPRMYNRSIFAPRRSIITILNNRVFLFRNYLLIAAPRKFDVLKTNICRRHISLHTSRPEHHISNTTYDDSKSHVYFHQINQMFFCFFFIKFFLLQYYLQRYTINYITYTTHTTYNTVLYYVFLPFCTHGTEKKRKEKKKKRRNKPNVN